jgi:hypothetical protein
MPGVNVPPLPRGRAAGGEGRPLPELSPPGRCVSFGAGLPSPLPLSRSGEGKGTA